jgi:hypothetical protein
MLYWMRSEWNYYRCPRKMRLNPNRLWQLYCTQWCSLRMCISADDNPKLNKLWCDTEITFATQLNILNTQCTFDSVWACDGTITWTNKNKRAAVEMKMMHKNYVCVVDWFQNSWGKAKKLGCNTTLLDYLSFARISWWRHWHHMYSEKMPKRILQAKLSNTSLWPPPAPLIRLR